jgi:hypothetical protein
MREAHAVFSCHPSRQSAILMMCYCLWEGFLDHCYNLGPFSVLFGDQNSCSNMTQLQSRNSSMIHVLTRSLSIAIRRVVLLSSLSLARLLTCQLVGREIATMKLYPRRAVISASTHRAVVWNLIRCWSVSDSAWFVIAGWIVPPYTRWNGCCRVRQSLRASEAIDAA